MAQQANSPGSGGQEKTTGQARAYAAGMYDIIKVVIHALILALLVRTFLYQPFNIPSGSMKETLLIGDYLFVSKFSYGYGRYSFYGDMSFIHGRIWAGEPKRGDVAVFRPPNKPGTDFIKRVIGLPGDRVRVVDSVVYINGQPVKREPAGEFVGTDDSGRPITVKQYRETLANGVSYLTLDRRENDRGDNTELFIVPPGHYFMMGDNRDNSLDSRFNVGFVPHENLVGPAQVLFFSVRNDAHPLAIWRWPTDMRLSRMFKPL
jgi:signal peptidase I